MITLAVMAVLATVASPSVTALLDRHRLQAAAHELQADIALARHESSRRGQTVTLQFQPGSLWCYSLSTGPAVDCRQPTLITGIQLIKRVQAPDHAGITLLRADTMVLDPWTGGRVNALASGQARFASRGGLQLQVRIGPQGRASVCAPAAPVPGNPPCPAEPSGP